MRLKFILHTHTVSFSFKIVQFNKIIVHIFCVKELVSGFVVFYELHIFAVDATTMIIHILSSLLQIY